MSSINSIKLLLPISRKGRVQISTDGRLLMNRKVIEPVLIMILLKINTQAFVDIRLQ